jgi:nicotinate-nucleotide adenylyltransferase
LEDLRSIGILGGTFNPPHLGHVALARHARDELALELVVLVPVGVPAHKTVAPDPGPEHRLAMCRLAVAGEERVRACAIEIERPGVSYTVDTVRALRARHEGAALTLLMGADVAATLASWREPAELLADVRLAVAVRPGAAPEHALAAVARAGGAQIAPAVLNMPALDVSSSRARELAGRGEAIDSLVGGAVAAYVREHGLYLDHGAGA